MIASDALNISWRIFLSKTFLCGLKRPCELRAKAAEWYSIVCGSSSIDLDESHDHDSSHALDLSGLLLELKSLARQLQRVEIPPGSADQLRQSTSSWRDHVASDGLPIPTEPLRFASHEKAMEVASYAFAHVACDETLVLDLIDADSSIHSKHPSRPWVHLLFQVAAGLDPYECVYRNRYRRGIGLMLIHSAMRYNDVQLFRHAEVILKTLNSTGIGWEETCTPLRIAHQATKAMRQEVETGRKIFLAVSSHRGFVEKSNILHDEGSEILTIHGMEADGRFFNDWLPL
ncbi:hypothetical protein GQ53DRAFT_753933, partial [Thozetella sp. PMI_491]